VSEVVCAGFALTAFLYHLIRIRAARRMKASPVEDRLIRSHLEVTAAGPSRQHFPPTTHPELGRVAQQRRRRLVRERHPRPWHYR
jgi:hypothetical protein